MDRSDKLEDLKTLIGKRDRLLISFSGGVDSSLLAYVAKDILGEKALCVILDSETRPRSELKHAETLAKSLGLNYQVARFSILTDKEFANNSPTRCYICKKISIQMLKNLAARHGLHSIAVGVNLTDYSDYRPGMAACEEEGIWHPFVDAKITKADIREIACSMKPIFPVNAETATVELRATASETQGGPTRPDSRPAARAGDAARPRRDTACPRHPGTSDTWDDAASRLA